MTTPELPHEKTAGIENIKFCTLHDAGQGRLILTIPKGKFGDQAGRMRDIIRKKLFPYDIPHASSLISKFPLGNCQNQSSLTSIMQGAEFDIFNASGFLMW